MRTKVYEENAIIVSCIDAFQSIVQQFHKQLSTKKKILHSESSSILYLLKIESPITNQE